MESDKTRKPPAIFFTAVAKWNHHIVKERGGARSLWTISLSSNAHKNDINGVVRLNRPIVSRRAAPRPRCHCQDLTAAPRAVRGLRIFFVSPLHLLYENYIPTDPEKQDSIIRKLSSYCGKPMFVNMTEEEDPLKWDFYHSFFFSYTVVSTIGYGNLAPTTHLSRILMIFYGLFGIPINGILLANLGEYFGLQIIRVYRKYKRRDEKRADRLNLFFHNFGMFGQIVLYLIPGFLFFIFLPACIFVVFEGWDYVAAVYYAFVTLTTIGFGDLVAGTINNGFAAGYFELYKIFLIVWITFGLGYIVMLLGFITSGMRSEKVHRIEQKLAGQLRTTQNRILQGFTRDIAIIRKIVNEANLIKLKPVYVEPQLHLVRSASCPVFTFDVQPRGPVTRRKRANSENIQLNNDMLRIQSDTDLLGIDKDKTFTASAIVKPAELLARVVNVLGGLEESRRNDGGIHMFNDEEILASERPSVWSIGQNVIVPNTVYGKRNRALSVAVPNYHKEAISQPNHDFTWTNGESAEKYFKGIRQNAKLSLPGDKSPNITNSPKFGENQPRGGILAKLFRKTSSSESPTDYIKNSIKGRMSINPTEDNVNDKAKKGNLFPTFDFAPEEKNELESYKEKTKRGRHSIFPTFDFSEDDEAAKAYKEKTKKGRHSIFPTFDFSDDEDIAATKAYKEKTKRGRHSIFPSFDFSENQTEPEAYKERSGRRRHSIFPTFDFSENEEDQAQKYKEKTKRGRHSIFPTFDFSENNDETIDEEEIRKYQKKTRKGRNSLFPSFGRHKGNDNDDDSEAGTSEEIKNYQNRTKRGRSSLFPSFGKDRKETEQDDSNPDISADIKRYQNRTKLGRNSLFAGDIQNYHKSTESGRSSLFGELDDNKGRTKRRPSLFDPDVNMSELPESQQVEVLEQTSVADLLRALAVLETASPSQGAGEPPGLLDLITGSGNLGGGRRGSIRPENTAFRSESDESATGPRRRRISARSAVPQFTPTLATVVAGTELQTTAMADREKRMSNLAQSPPPYSEAATKEETQPRVRRYSPAPGGPVARPGSGPVPRLFSRIRKESVTSVEDDSRRGSLTDIVIESNKDKT